MTIQCTQLDDLLLEGDAFSMRAAAQHAETCDGCMQKLADWNEISGTAREMQVSWNSDLLWPRIERALKNEQPTSRRHVWQIAASFAIFISLAGLLWFANHRTRQAEFDDRIIRASRVDEVERAQQAHLNAINQLETLAEAKLEQPSTPLMVSYKEKLMVLDDAIAECQTNIDHNRQNAYLRKQLASIYSEKQRTLQDVLREESHAQTIENR